MYSHLHAVCRSAGVLVFECCSLGPVGVLRCCWIVGAVEVFAVGVWSVGAVGVLG